MPAQSADAAVPRSPQVRHLRRTAEASADCFDLGKGEQEVANYNYGRALQLSGNWDSAQVIFKSTLEKYAPPVDDRGDVQLLLLNLPLRIHRALIDAGDSLGAKVWF